MFRYSFKTFCLIFCLLLAFLFTYNCLTSEGPPPLKFSDSAENIIYFVPQFSEFQEVSIHELRFLKEVLAEAKEKNVKAVIFELDTPGGRVDYAYKYISVLEESEVPTIAFVNHHGISAGLIIALAADRIAISPNGIIGDAMPLQISMAGIRPIVDKPEEDKKKPSSAKDEKSKPPAKEADKKQEKDQGENTKVEKKKDQALDRVEKMIKDLDKLGKKQQISPEEKKLLDQKQLTVFFKRLQVMAEKNKRPVKVIKAMADPYQKLSEKEDGIEHTKVSPLTLTAVEAKRLHVVDYICRNSKELKKELGLENCKVVIKNKTPTHIFLFFLAHPFVSGVLIIVGLIGLYIEAKTPGFGFAGGLGIAALALFFIGHVGIGDSNWLPTAIFLIGIILLALEIFVIPGFGITGISGIIAILASLLLAFGLENIELAINTVGIAIIAAAILMVYLTLYVLPKSTFVKKISLEMANKSKAGFSSHKKPDDSLINMEGIVHTTLRPTGIAIIDEQRLDVMTEGDFIEKGGKVKVTRVEGMRIIVEKA